MQTPFELFNEIENNLPVEQIKCKGLSIWQFLRFQYQLQYMKLYTVNGLISQKTSITKKLKRILIIFKNSFWGFFNYYKKSHYILFSNQYNNKLIDEKISDKFSHHIIKHLGPQLLIFQDPANMEHISIKNYYHKRYTSSWSLYIRCLPKIFMSLINCLKYKIEGEEILKQVEKSIGIHINYRFKTSLFFIFSNFLNKNFKKRNTKLIFVECYHGIIHQAAIYAAKKNNIPSIEIQHGLISKTYEGYILPKKIGQECFPDYLFAFGNYVKETLGDSFINNKNIYPVGYFYIEYIKKQAKYNEYFKEYFNKLRLSYKTIVTISGQDTIDKELFIFIEKAALLDNQILYLFIPRTFNNNYYKISLPSNIKIKPDID
ncbi:MAG TPA: hypothetical protein P5250_06965, partial [Bacteroidales bacterium]|nr:hypothetical protein [Bacteroidales bacterium]